MTNKQQNIYQILFTTLLTIIGIFGVYSSVVLTNLNKKMNELIVAQKLQELKINENDKEIAKQDARIYKLEKSVFNIP